MLCLHLISRYSSIYDTLSMRVIFRTEDRKMDGTVPARFYIVFQLNNCHSVPEIPVYEPTVEEFLDFNKCISKIEELGAHHVGLCKVIPPPGWVARTNGYDDIDSMVVDKPICQITYGSRGIFVQDIKPMRTLSFKEFKNLANSDPYCTPQHRDWNHAEKKYWSSISTGRPIYGANVSGSLMRGQKAWNTAELDSLLTRVLKKQNVLIPGVNTPYLYYEYFRPDFLNCHCFLRHKCVLISPSILTNAGIPTKKIIQNRGEFMITFPYAYHAGFNLGLNIAEAINFALPRWIDFGKKAQICTCWDDTVRICMDPFVRLYQPKSYDAWKHGSDTSPHPLEEYESYKAELSNSAFAFTLKPENRASNDRPRLPVIKTFPYQRFQSGCQKYRPVFSIGDLNLIDLRFHLSGLSSVRLVALTILCYTVANLGSGTDADVYSNSETKLSAFSLFRRTRNVQFCPVHRPAAYTAWPSAHKLHHPDRLLKSPHGRTPPSPLPYPTQTPDNPGFRTRVLFRHVYPLRWIKVPLC
ncbi:jumonji domain-containing protein 2 [Paragonimus westermani]|uniref:Jumonji domain-containing protein 2 n=1 Tax=Paragonimus westermani TaxID=34504 RepID=A0A5J4N688_9TREM|nr:jumonji domain-containing protein 2 [Paragonimus westermani]